MPASISGTAPNLALPSHSRSHEGPGAGSSDQPGRRDPRASSTAEPGASREPADRGSRPRSSNVLPGWFVEHARRMLHQQRAFRIDQLRRLDASSGVASDVAREEIDATLREAAQSVVTLVDSALLRIDQGNYGRCHRCGDLMSLNRLAVLPMSTLCGRCQRQAGGRLRAGLRTRAATGRRT
jgi:DnaK suppressor protein